MYEVSKEPETSNANESPRRHKTNQTSVISDRRSSPPNQFSYRQVNEKTSSKTIPDVQSNLNLEKKNERPYLEAVEDYKKMCSKSYGVPNTNIVTQLKQEKLNLFLDHLNPKEITNISKILEKYYYFKEIYFGPFDPQKGDPHDRKKKDKDDGNNSKFDSKAMRIKKRKEIEMRKAKSLTLSTGFEKNLPSAENLTIFKISNLPLITETSKHIGEGLNKNQSIRELSITNCVIPLDSYEQLLKGLLIHEKIEILDLSNNKFDDKYGNMISRIIARQTQRRDQIVWSYGLRNEKPESNEYMRGLISINLSNNQLGELSADEISNSLLYDQYVRKIDLSNNKFTSTACKKFIKMLRTNNSLLNINLKFNEGYDNKIEARLVMKMCKNIKNLYKDVIEGNCKYPDYEYYKGFIDSSFFALDKIEGYTEEGENPLIQSDEMNSNNMNTKGYCYNNNYMVEDEIPEEEDSKNVQYNANTSESNKKTSVLNSMNNTKKSNSKRNNNYNISNKKSSSNSSKKCAELEQKNKQLLSENVKLRKDLVEIKARVLQQNLEEQIEEDIGEIGPDSIEVKNYNKIVTLLEEANTLIENTENNLVNKNKNSNIGTNQYEETSQENEYSNNIKNKHDEMPLSKKDQDSHSKNNKKDNYNNNNASNNASNNKNAKIDNKNNNNDNTKKDDKRKQTNKNTTNSNNKEDTLKSKNKEDKEKSNIKNSKPNDSDNKKENINKTKKEVISKNKNNDESYGEMAAEPSEEPSDNDENKEAVQKIFGENDEYYDNEEEDEEKNDIDNVKQADNNNKEEIKNKQKDTEQNDEDILLIKKHKDDEDEVEPENKNQNKNYKEKHDEMEYEHNEEGGTKNKNNNKNKSEEEEGEEEEYEVDEEEYEKLMKMKELYEQNGDDIEKYRKLQELYGNEYLQQMFQEGGDEYDEEFDDEYDNQNPKSNKSF